MPKLPIIVMQANPNQPLASRPTRRASMTFMDILRKSWDPPASVQGTWPDLAAQSEAGLVLVQNEVMMPKPFMMLVQAEPKQAPVSRPTKRASMAFMEMLREARDPPVSVQSTWLEVAAQFEGDSRCAVIAEEQRHNMYDTFREALAKIEESKAQQRHERAADDFKVIYCPK